ncbi:ribokinase [Chelatococcus sambhunathii]|uniref:Ribokinase n=1 Tax=Chelatococcus sambhunathii TaxID=363953 RepID=A0ABU1DBQ0_9HYPH|nr:ribokinase [Chelatococcus sambhunathii]MDR4305458.1 ribokinase [Chelatococcus sambhunathii]
MATAGLFVVGSFVAACCVEVDALPEAGETLSARSFSMEPGGKGFNLAVAARRLGAEVGGLFAVGDDDLARLAPPAFERAGLSPELLRRKAGPTGGGVGFIAADGETCLAVASGANAALSAEDVRSCAKAIDGAAICLAQFESPDAPVLEAFSIARRAGRFTLLNPSPFRPMSDALLAVTSALCVNRTEARALATSLDAAGDDLEALAQAAFAKGPDALVVTLGGRGALAFRRGEPTIEQSAFPVVAVDALGAGDGFAAALATSLAEGRGWEAAMRRAAAAGALTATIRGTFDAFPNDDALDRLVRATF